MDPIAVLKTIIGDIFISCVDYDADLQQIEGYIEGHIICNVIVRDSCAEYTTDTPYIAVELKLCITLYERRNKQDFDVSIWDYSDDEFDLQWFCSKLKN